MTSTETQSLFAEAYKSINDGAEKAGLIAKARLLYRASKLINAVKITNLFKLFFEGK